MSRLLLASLLALLASTASASVVHVDARALPGGDGNSWSSAHDALGPVLAAAREGTEIHIAAGTYAPIGDANINASTFVIPHGVTLVGGFPPGGGVRDSTQHRVVLSGEIISYYGSVGIVWHVVTIPIGATATISGCTIRGGRAEGGGSGGEGGGILCLGALVLRDCRIVDNRANYGAGIVVRSPYGGPPATLRAVGCTILGNQSDIMGGGIFAPSPSTVVLEACRLLGNQAWRGGGIWAGAGATLGNCVFSGNRAGTGGAVYLDGGASRIAHCTVTGNVASQCGGIVMRAGERPPTLTLLGSIVWGNSQPGGDRSTAAQLRVTSGSAIARTSIEGGAGALPATDVGDWAPEFLAPTGADGIVGTEDDDVRLFGASACAERGSVADLPLDGFDRDGDGDVTETVPYDISCDPRVRIVPDGSTQLDLGAHQGVVPGLAVTPPVLRLTEGGTGSFTIRLLTRPMAPVTVLVSLSGDPSVVVAPFTFTPATWQEPVSVPVHALHDGDYRSGITVCTFTMPGGRAVQAQVTITDDDQPPAILHVDAAATGAGTGVGWPDAMPDLQAALASAMEHSAVREVRIAGGTYAPSPLDRDPTVSFVIRSGLIVRGGFAGEQDPAQRSPTSLPTVLTSDNGLEGYRALHVVRILAGTAATLVEGLQVAGGGAHPGPTGNGVLIVDGMPVLRQVRIHGHSGVAVGIDGTATPIFEACTFTDSDTGIRAEAGSRPVFTGCTFTGSRKSALSLLGPADLAACTIATNADGIVMVGGSIVGTTFHGNRGGALRLGPSPRSARIVDCHFRGNGSGADRLPSVRADGCPVQLERCRFSTLVDARACTFYDRATAGMIDCRFDMEGEHDVLTLSQAYSDAVYANASTLRLERCRFTQMVLSGSALSAYQSTVLMAACDFIGTRSRPSTTTLQECTSRITACRWLGGTGEVQSGALRISDGTATIADSVFAANTSPPLTPGSGPEFGSAIQVSAAVVTIANTTIDHSAQPADGVHIAVSQQGGTLGIANSVLASSTQPGLGQDRMFRLESGTAVFTHCLVQGWDGAWAGSRTSAAAPRFAAPAGADGVRGTADDDFRVLVGSPAIDAGDSTRLVVDALDRDGDGNVTEADPVDVTGAPRVAGAAVDIGAYEGTALLLVFDPSPCRVPEGGRATVMVRLSAQPSAPLTTTLTLSGDSDLTLIDAVPLVFTPADWAMPRPVVIAAANDPDYREGQAVLVADARFAGGTSVHEIDDEPVPTRLYVDLAATGAGTGESWADAYPDLHTALARARELPQVESVWIAAGVYRPAADGSGRLTTYRVRDRLALLGGFVNGQTDPAQRDLRRNRTLINGDLDRNDDIAVFSSYFDNTHHLITLDGPAGGVLLSGLAISGGRAASRVPFMRAAGGGILVESGALIVRECSFEGNWGHEGGSAIFSKGELTLDRCRFVGENSWEGGAVESYGSLRASRCDFIAGQGGYRGSAMILHPLVDASASHTLYNCRFLGNKGTAGALVVRNEYLLAVNCVFSGNQGGALQTSGNQSLTVAYSTMVGNSSQTGAGGIDAGGNTHLVNNILWGNRGAPHLTLLDQQMRLYSSPTRLSRNCIMGSVASPTGGINVDPRLVSLLGVDGVAGTEDDDLSLAWDSPCIDAGEDRLGLDPFDLDGDGDTTEELPIDLAGHRRRNDHPRRPDTGIGKAPLPDMGAYEVQSGGRAPTGVVLAPATVVRRSPAGTVVGVLTASDEDLGDRHRFVLVPGEGDDHNAQFTITGSTLVCAAFVGHPAGPRSIRVRAVDRDDLSAERILTVMVTDPAPPRITAIDSTTPAGTYRRNDPIAVSLRFERPATLTGVMRLTFDTGAALDVMAFTGSSAIEAVHIVGLGERTSDLNVVSVTLVGGALVDTNGEPFSLLLPTPSFAANEAIVLTVGRRIEVRARDGIGAVALDGQAVQGDTIHPGAPVGDSLRFEALDASQDASVDLQRIPVVNQ